MRFITSPTYAEVDADLLLKQDTLVSGTNIKTINSTSLLWSGDLVIWWWSSGWGYPIIGNPVVTTARICPYLSNPQNRSSSSITANRVYFIPFTLNEDINILELWYIVWTANAWSSIVGIYDTLSWRPNDLVCTTSLLVNSIGYVSESITSTALTKWSLYRLSIVSDTTTSINFYPVTSVMVILAQPVTSNSWHWYYYTDVWAWRSTLPATAWTPTTSSFWALPALFIRSRS